MTTPSPASEPSPHTAPAAPHAAGYAPPPGHQLAQSPAAPSSPQHGYSYAAPGGAYPAAAPSNNGARPARNILGIIALGLGILVLLTGSVSLLAQAGMMSAGNYYAIGVVSGIISTFQGVLAGAAIVCGGIGLAQKGRSKGPAGIGLGLGVAVLWSVLGGVFYGAILQFVR